MKVIFVDIDGPLAYGLWEHGARINENLKLPYSWEKEDCVALAEIIKRTDAKVVISSDWKKYYTLEELGLFFEFYEIPNVIIGVTHERKAKLRSAPPHDRAYQIRDWLEEHADEVETWVAIDDMNVSPFFEDMTDEYPYITKENHVWLIGDWSDTIERLRDNVEKIITVLNGKAN